VPFIGPFTGAEFLRNPYNRYIVNLRSSYFEETEAWIEHLTTDLGIAKIAILYQDDAFGLAGLEGVQKAMAKRNMTLVAQGSFKRNTVAVKSALLDIMKAQPEAVVTVAPYKPVAEFIKLAHDVQLNALFVAISFVGSDSLAKELGKDGAGVIISQVVPSPWDDSLPVVASYQHALGAADATAKPGFVSLEGYVVGRLAVEALKRIKGEPSREGLLDTPRRVISAYDEMFGGYRERAVDVLERTFSETGGYDDLVLVRDIPFHSHCEHHMMPFFGKAHVAYMPVERVVGLSKLARLIDVYARRLQTQEHLTSQVAAAIEENLKPRGVAVMLEAEHM